MKRSHTGQSVIITRWGALLFLFMLTCVQSVAQAWQYAAPDPNAPMVAEVRVLGNKGISAERIKSKLKTYAERPYDKKTIEEDVKRLFATHWFLDVAVQEKPADNGVIVIFQVIERPTIQELQFIGNIKFSDKELMDETGLAVGKSMDPGLNKMMARKVEEKYRKKGYPFVTVELVEGGTRGDTRVIMKISEGPKTKIAKVKFEGNEFVNDPRLATNVKGKPFGYILPVKYDPEKINDDLGSLIDYYRSHGFLDVRIGRRLDWTEDKKKVAVTYIIEEGPQYKVNDIRFAGNRVFADDKLEKDLKLVKGEILRKGTLDQDVKSLKNAYGREGYIHSVVNADVRYLEEPGLVDVVYNFEEDLPRRVGVIKVVGNEITKDQVIRRRMDLEPGELANTEKMASSQQRLIDSRLFKVSPQEGVMPTVDWDPSIDPLSEYQDVIVNVQEDQTGSLMFGVGVNSDSGFGGSLVLNERNFDITRFPRSFSDLTDFRAFRGGGQELRIEAVPGTQVHRYMVSLREPMLFGTDYSLSTSGYYFRRLYTQYTEQRAGGRFGLGRRFSRRVGASLETRIEQIDISDPSTPTPPDIQEVLGGNFLTSIRAAVDHDTRDSNMNPGSGHFIEMAYEQAFGDFNFPRFTIEGRQYWTLFKRADGSGKQVLSLTGEFGYSGEDTPVFERFYAGGFRSLRGFQFRGVSPTQLGVEVGGDFMLLSSLQYYLPLTADDNFGAVAFIDTGTVESDVEILDYRAAAGFGLRVTVPMMGPVPLAFDFAFPISKKDTDDTQIFSFFLGVFR